MRVNTTGYRGNSYQYFNRLIFFTRSYKPSTLKRAYIIYLKNLYDQKLVLL